MKKNILIGTLALLFLGPSFTSCTKDMPKSLSEILKRNDVDGYGNGGGGNAEAGGGSPSVYKGANADYVHLLLSKVPGWVTPSCGTCNDGVPPVVPINNTCQRDAYVAAAVSFAWAAESAYRLGAVADASSFAGKMMESLQAAKNLCGPSTVNGGGSCLTLNIFPC